MTNPSVFIAVWFFCFHGITPDLPGQKATDQKIPDTAQVIADLISEDNTKSRNAASLIQKSRDPKWLDHLSPLLESSQGRSRQIVTMLVLGVYPDQATDFFRRSSRSESVFAREASMYGFARISQPEMADLLLQGVEDSDGTVRNAALRGLQWICRPNGTQLIPALQSAESLPLAGSHPARPQLQDRLSALTITQNLKSWRGIWQDVALRRTILAVQDRYSRSQVEDLRSDLDRIFKTNNQWSAKPPQSQTLRYDFSMVNIVAGSSKDIRIDATPEEVALTRLLGYDLDRCVPIRLAVDHWLEAPHLYTAKISIKDPQVLVEIDLTGAPALYAGVGLLNISYWQSRVSTGASAVLTFDRKTGRWIQETVRDSSGRVVWEANASSWLESERSQPGQILIQMPEGQVGAQRYSLSFEAKFSSTKGIGHLTQATMTERVTNSSGTVTPELRAMGELQLDVSEGD